MAIITTEPTTLLRETSSSRKLSPGRHLPTVRRTVLPCVTSIASFRMTLRTPRTA